MLEYVKCGGWTVDNIKDTLNLMMKGLFHPDNKLSLIPNWVSASRALCGVLIPVMVLSGTSFEVLFGTLFYAAISDFLDGKLARMVVREETDEGAMLDAISDKVFAILLMTFLIPFVKTISINLVLEGAIAVINGKILSSGREPKSNFIGKIKTWPIFISLGLGYLGLSSYNLGIDMNSFINVSSALSAVSIPLEVMSAKKYFDEYKKKDNTSSFVVISEDEDILEEVKEKEDREFSISLDRSKNVRAMVFERTMDDDMELENGKQKKIEF